VDKLAGSCRLVKGERSNAPILGVASAAPVAEWRPLGIRSVVCPIGLPVFQRDIRRRMFLPPSGGLRLGPPFRTLAIARCAPKKAASSRAMCTDFSAPRSRGVTAVTHKVTPARQKPSS
jgi:hypothetical protein